MELALYLGNKASNGRGMAGNKQVCSLRQLVFQTQASRVSLQPGGGERRRGWGAGKVGQI